MTRADRAALASLALGSAAFAAVRWAAHRPPGARALPYLVGHALLALCALAACAYVAWRHDPRRALRAVLVGAIVLRFALLTVAPFTTTDVARYLWDGAVANAGFDPYALPPIAAELAGLRASFPPPLDHPDVATCYPPLALALFCAAAAFGARAMIAWKALCVGASALTAWLVARACDHTNRQALAPIALLGPVAVLEAGVGAHLDTFVALAAVGMVLAAQRARWNVAALCAGGVFALKIVPAVFALPVLVRAPRRVWFAALALAPAALSFGAAELLGMTPPGSLPLVAQHWSFGSPLWSALYARFPFDDEAIRAGLAAAGLLSIALISLPRRDIAHSTRDAMGLSLAVSPVVYPWYGTSLASVIALAPSAWAALALLAAPLSYEVIDAYQSRGVWSPARWPMDALALLVGLGLAVDLWRRRAR